MLAPTPYDLPMKPRSAVVAGACYAGAGVVFTLAVSAWSASHGGHPLWAWTLAISPLLEAVLLVVAAQGRWVRTLATVAAAIALAQFGLLLWAFSGPLAPAVLEYLPVAALAAWATAASGRTVPQRREAVPA